jgi:hypothetical protein
MPGYISYGGADHQAYEIGLNMGNIGLTAKRQWHYCLRSNI